MTTHTNAQAYPTAVYLHHLFYSLLLLWQRHSLHLTVVSRRPPPFPHAMSSSTPSYLPWFKSPTCYHTPILTSLLPFGCSILTAATLLYATLSSPPFHTSLDSSHQHVYHMLYHMLILTFLFHVTFHLAVVPQRSSPSPRSVTVAAFHTFPDSSHQHVITRSSLHCPFTSPSPCKRSSLPVSRSLLIHLKIYYSISSSSDNEGLTYINDTLTFLFLYHRSPTLHVVHLLTTTFISTPPNFHHYNNIQWYIHFIQPLPFSGKILLKWHTNDLYESTLIPLIFDTHHSC